MANPGTSSNLGVAGDPLLPADKALDHAWRYFALHAQQRISVFNFFIVLSGIVATGIGAGFQAGKPMAPVVAILGALLTLFSFVFYRLDRRGSELVKLAEAALILGENTCMPEFARSCGGSKASRPRRLPAEDLDVRSIVSTDLLGNGHCGCRRELMLALSMGDVTR